ncbi:hypothetical protein K0M31_003464 [Melipona bicolor]|uniref:Odorant receptor n=1 Tax=Melipona bicolor TaxID=60889 RepID=A0AA40FZ83_9HYME|nr:hypothetical protein K0M31_003464 [Melipona bicolor]
MNWQTVEDQYLRDNKFFAQLVGVWPQQPRFTKLSIRLFIFVLVIVALITQVSRVIVFYTIETLMDEVVYLVISITILIKQYNYILNEKKLEELLSEIVIDHLMARPEGELEILDTYFRKAIIFSSIYKASISTSALMFILIPAIPPILNIIAPLNQSRGREFVYPAYFFVDEQRYYYPILANMIIGALVLAAVYIASDINLIYLIHHGCALLAISGYRFKHALDDVNLYDEKYNDALMHEAYAKVCRSIEGHKRAVEYEANWYSGSSRTQLLYVLVLRKCLNPPVLSGGGLVPLNLFSFVQVSRVIVFYSMDVLLDQMVYLDIIISIFTKQYHCVLNATKLKELLREIVVDRMLGYPKEELEILDSYFNKAVYFCFVYKGNKREE